MFQQQTGLGRPLAVMDKEQYPNNSGIRIYIDIVFSINISKINIYTNMAKYMFGTISGTS